MSEKTDHNAVTSDIRRRLAGPSDDEAETKAHPYTPDVVHTNFAAGAPSPTPQVDAGVSFVHETSVEREPRAAKDMGLIRSEFLQQNEPSVDDTSPMRRIDSAIGRPLEKPIQLGRYSLLQLLGKGGMAEVYLARQEGIAGFEKTCVIKRIRKALVEEKKFVDMFVREARVAARLNHRNVVQIFELCQEGEEYFIAMEYLDGITLHRAARRCWLNDQSVPMEVVLRTVADAALGLHHAHTLRTDDGRIAPLIHRDISPDNLMLSRDGNTKVLDFGIAKNFDAEEVTKTGELKGKIPYMSPEQINGSNLDGRSDLWSLGVTFYWLLTGQRPFDGKTEPLTIDNIMRKAPRPPREINPLIPKQVQNVVLRLLEKDRDKRISDGETLHGLLVQLLGAASGSGPAAEFANNIMTLAPVENQQQLRGSVITVIAAQPQSRWLKHIDENSEGLENLLPELTPDGGYPAMAGTKREVEANSEVKTADTVSRIHSAPGDLVSTSFTSTNSIAFQAGAKKDRIRLAASGAVAALLLGFAAYPILVDAPDDVVASSTTLPPPVAPASTTGLPVEPPTPINAPRDVGPDADVRPTVAKGIPKLVDVVLAVPARVQVKLDKRSKELPVVNNSVQVLEGTESLVIYDEALGKTFVRKIENGQLKYQRPSPSGDRVTLKGAPTGWFRGVTKAYTGDYYARDGARSVQVVNDHGGIVDVPIRNGVADYDAIDDGTLTIRAIPWANIVIGKTKYGQTPLAKPVKLKAGTYTITFEYEGIEIKKKVTVEPRKNIVVGEKMK